MLGLSPLTARSSAASAPAVQLTGGSIAFVMGGSGIPLPSDGYVNAANLFYLQPHGFTGTAQSLFTPQLYFPGNLSEVQGAQILAEAINKEVATGEVNAENPVYVFGYSQSAAMSAMTMEQLQHQGVPAEDVHFVLVGNAANPNGGIVEMLNLWGGDLTFWNGLTLGHPTPDYYTTDVYTMEYDGYADFPKYPLNLLSTLNAIAGMFLIHDGYLGLSHEDIANAIPLDSTDPSGLTNYYMIPTEHLPLLDLLRLNPVWGSPLAALLEPSMRILVNLGYGSLTEGWNQGPANVPTTISWDLLPSNISLTDINAALSNAWTQGVQDMFKELQDPKTYIPGGFLGEEPFSMLWTAAQRVFFDMQDAGSLFGGSAEATDPADTDFPNSLGSVVDGNPDLSWIADLLGLDTIDPA
ncbi:PE-PPE domain-containing protein [Mycolicibacter terrae]|uniref:PE-PPE domain-containing protein n=2 Tax=Mycolicibacter TaxID=1073531 RepID=A0A1A2NJN1_MYCSD|nr:PE-PPE domain-containing protein [Mycolicibacter sinensis]OBI30442.1 PE-PPE domain-containing protein [Mycolicibacter sinensis]RRR39925.1 PE-PPE domain-containing protein [Mycolicibacter terrae]